MALMHSTTTVSVDKTLTEIERLLARAGARSIRVDYQAAGTPTAVSFVIETPRGARGFRLPADLEAIWRVLTRQWQQGHMPRRFTTREQAARVGWWAIKDWLEAQLVLVETQMVCLEQVMLPYLRVADDQVLYDAYREQELPLPTTEPGRA
jgi:hypothetical protein